MTDSPATSTLEGHAVIVVKLRDSVFVATQHHEDRCIPEMLHHTAAEAWRSRTSAAAAVGLALDPDDYVAIVATVHEKNARGAHRLVLDWSTALPVRVALERIPQSQQSPAR